MRIGSNVKLLNDLNSKKPLLWLNNENVDSLVDNSKFLTKMVSISKLGRKTVEYIMVKLKFAVVVDTKGSKQLTTDKRNLHHFLSYSYLGCEPFYSKLQEIDTKIKNNGIHLGDAFKKEKAEWEKNGPHIHWCKTDYSNNEFWEKIHFVEPRKNARRGKKGKNNSNTNSNTNNDSNTNSTAIIPQVPIS
eukprot:181273_1